MDTRPTGRALELRGRTRLLLGVGIVFAILAVIGAILNRQLFFHAYLTAYWFWLTIALGCLGVLMIQNLAGGFWGAVLRRELEAAARTLPLLAVLFIPILVGLPTIYTWTGGNIGNPALPGFKQVYLSLPFFIARAVLYFAVWIILELLLVRWSLERDTNPDPALTHRMRALSAGGLVVLALTGTYASVDWLMSLEVAWFSSIFGAIIGMGGLLAGFAFAIFLLTRWADLEPYAGIVSPRLYNSLGSLLLAFLMLWAYMTFSQLILIYAGNLPAETIWYVHRMQGPWLLVGLVWAFLEFIIPFCFLIMRGAKRSRRVLGAVCLLLVVAHYINLFWVVQPSYPNDSPLVVLYNIVLALAIGGFGLALAATQLAGWPLLARNDPQLIAGLEMAHEQ